MTTTKIQYAIDDTNLKLSNVKQQIMLLSRERDVLQALAETLKSIQKDDKLK